MELLPKLVEYILTAEGMQCISGLSVNLVLTLPCGDRVEVQKDDIAESTKR